MSSGKQRSSTSRDTVSHGRPRTSNVVTSADYEELKRHYKFVLPEDKEKEGKSWQDRMVQHYHSHLYKEFAIVDLSVPGRIGLRFRTKAEVVSGKGFQTCGNKHCPSYKNPELYTKEARDRHLARQGDARGVGEGLCDYEVPFQYVEHNEQKMELVKLRLCLSCAPLLMERSGSAKRVVDGDKKRKAEDEAVDPRSGSSSSSDRSSNSSSDESSESSEDSHRKRKSRSRRRKRSHSKKREEKETQSNQKDDSSEDGEPEYDSSRERSRRRRRRREEKHKRKKKHKKRKHRN